MSIKLKFIKYMCLFFGVIGLFVTLFSTFFGDNDYTLAPKIVIAVMFTVFFTLGPWLLYKFFSFMDKTGL